MNVLIIGDIFGKLGRKMLEENIEKLKQTYQPDMMIANSENICHGKGPKLHNIRFLENLGFDVLTAGNHTFVNVGDIQEYLESPECIQIRPANYYESMYAPRMPGKGFIIIEKNGKKILVISLLSNTFMRDTLYNPFLRVQEIISEVGPQADVIIVDFHKEVTSEGYALANLLDGKASLIYGTHTHIQTNDDQIFPGGTGFISDIGFVWAQRSIIGVTWESIKDRFTTGVQYGKMTPDEEGSAILNGLFAQISDDGKCTKIEKIQIRQG